MPDRRKRFAFAVTPPWNGANIDVAEAPLRSAKPDKARACCYIPARAGFTFTVDTLAAINKVPHFRGLKNTDVDLVTGAFCASRARLSKSLPAWSFRPCRCLASEAAE